MKKRILSLLTAFTMTACMLSSNMFVASAEEKSDDIVILYTNDVHCYIDGNIRYSTIAGLKSALEEQYNNVILVDAGDHIQGTAYGSMDKGKTIIDLMNATGYDLATLGNHEFDYGQGGRINVTDNWAQFPYISCNFMDISGQESDTVLEPYKIFEFGDTTLAFIGITTPEAFTSSTPAYFQDDDGNYIYDILGGDDGSELYDAVQDAIDSSEVQSADYVIALGHLGNDYSASPWTSEELVANTTGIDAFIDGHSHSTVEGKLIYDKDENSVLLTQTGEYLNSVGMMTIDAETGEITSKLIRLDDVTADTEVSNIENRWLQNVDGQLGSVIGRTEFGFTIYDSVGNRTIRKQETNLGDFAADALYYLFDTTMGQDVDVAIVNGGGIRASFPAGVMSYKTMKTVHTFGNVACLINVTGQQILDALEWGAKDTPASENGGFLQVAGITYDIDTSIESTVQKDSKGVWIGSPTGEYRVKNVKVYNKKTNTYEPLDLTARYNLAGYNYNLRDLGDGYAMFDDARNVLDYVMEDYMVLSNYVMSFPDATIKATNSPLLAKYPSMLLDYSDINGSGRIDFSVAQLSEIIPEVGLLNLEAPEEGMTVAELLDSLEYCIDRYSVVSGIEGVMVFDNNGYPNGEPILLESDDVFEVGKDYVLQIAVVPDEDYAFDTTTKITVNGSTELTEKYSSVADENMILICVEFSAMEVTVIEEAGFVNFEIPAVGMSVDDFVDAIALIEGLEGVKDTDIFLCEFDGEKILDFVMPGEVFEEGKSYAFQINIETEMGYIFDETTKITINGSTDLVSDYSAIADKHTAIIVAEFSVSADTPADEPTDEPASKPTDEPADEPTDKPSEENNSENNQPESDDNAQTGDDIQSVLILNLASIIMVLLTLMTRRKTSKARK